MSTPRLSLCVLTFTAVALGTWLHPNEVWLFVLVASVATCWLGKQGLLIGVLFAVAALISEHAWTQLDQDLPKNIDGVVRIAEDPESARFGSRAEISFEGRKFQAWFDIEQSKVLKLVQAGDRVRLKGEVSELTGKATPSLRRKHVAGRVQVETVELESRAGGLFGIANSIRSIVTTGADPMSPESRALYRGLVMGDDRDQSETQREEFRNAGITHLLAVSGQNVAFLLLVLSPVLLLLGRKGRLFAVLAVLVIFGTVTRWEPSVVRAVVMAAVVVLARYSGRQFDPWRTLLLAASIAMLMDPFLIGSIGFLLSVAACAGIAGLSTPLCKRLPGPTWVSTPLGVTASAQIGVAPVQLAVFGPMPVVALLTNLAAGPLAAFVMMWGMTAGLIAGLLGGPWAVVLSWPPEKAIQLLAWVAQVGSEHSSLTWQIPSTLVAIGLLVVLPKRRQHSWLDEMTGPSR